MTNPDGSIDIGSGPALAADVPDSNFIQTIEGRDVLAVLRLCGAELAFFDQSWKLDDLVKVE